MNSKETLPSIACTQSTGPKTVVMESPPEMVLVLDEDNQKAPPADLRATRMASPRSISDSMRKTAVFRRVRMSTSISARPTAMQGKGPIVPAPKARAPGPRPSVPKAVLRALPPPLPKKTEQARASVKPAPRTEIVGTRMAMSPRTRMVNLKDAISRAPLPPLPLPQPPPLELSIRREPQLKHSLPQRFENIVRSRSRLLAFAGLGSLACIAMLLGGSPSAEGQRAADDSAPPSQASVAAPGIEHSTPRTHGIDGPSGNAEVEAEPAPKTSEPLASASESEQKAAALLLAGKRREALDLYRALAREPGANEGVVAMALVLQQKVEKP